MASHKNGNGFRGRRLTIQFQLSIKILPGCMFLATFSFGNADTDG